VALFGIYVVCPNGMVTDSIRTVSVAENMLYRRTINLDHQRDTMPTKGYGVDMVGGHVLPRFPWAGAVFAVPLIVGYDGLHRIGVGPGTEGAIAASGGNDLEFQLVTMGLVVAATAVIMWEVAVLALAGIADVRRRRRLALVAALVFALCTSARPAGPGVALSGAGGRAATYGGRRRVRRHGVGVPVHQRADGRVRLCNLLERGPHRGRPGHRQAVELGGPAVPARRGALRRRSPFAER
jgi:hypothetical protein